MIKRYSCNLSEDFLKDTKITPYWVTGITDGGGKFSITLKSKICYCSFEITQKKVDNTLYMLYFIQEYFNCGEIVLDSKQFDNKYNTYKFIVTNLEDLCNIILPHFDKYPLITSKHLDYLDFKKIVLMCKEGLNLININREKIFSIKNNMNSKRSFYERLDFNLSIKSQKLNNEWVQAFIDIRGLFHFYVSKIEINTCINIPFLILRLRNDEFKLIILLMEILGKASFPREIINIDILKSNRTFLCGFFNCFEIIKFVDKYEMFTYNNFDYYLWKKLINLNDKEAYNTWDDLSKMWGIKYLMYGDKIYLGGDYIKKMPFYIDKNISFRTKNLDYFSFQFKEVTLN